MMKLIPSILADFALLSVNYILLGLSFFLVLSHKNTMNKAPTAAKRELLTAKISGKTKGQLKALAALSGKTLTAYLEELIASHCEAETKKQTLPEKSRSSSWRNLLKN